MSSPLRIAPPYEKLKYLILVKKHSYRTVAEMYGMHPSTVGDRFRRDAIRAGEWEYVSAKVQADLVAKRRRMRLEAHHLQQGSVIVDMLRHYLDETWPYRTRSAQVFAFCEKHEFNESHLRRILRYPRKHQMTKGYAVRILTAIGEPLNPELKAYMTQPKNKLGRLPERDRASFEN